ncbi:MAG: indole-3-glycerol phosphate synthase TrpC [Gemmatimonadaceae bacterium]
MSDISFFAAGLRMDRSADPTEHLPNSYVSRRSTEAQAFDDWTPPGGTLGALTDEARARAATLQRRTAELRQRASIADQPPSFRDALCRTDVAVIAELKRSSPSKGAINPGLDPVAQCLAYQTGGAAAVSILTEPTQFGGSNEDLSRARDAVSLPLLKKDFHVDVVQMFEARALGASAALVIARAVPPTRVRELFAAASDIGLEVLLEIRDERELELAMSIGASLVGVNSRDLETLQIDLETAPRILPLIPRDVVVIAESGVRSALDVERLAEAGADAVLVGSVVSASLDPAGTVRSLTGIRRTSGARKS